MFAPGGTYKIMSKPVFTIWEYVGMKTQHLLNNFSEWQLLFTAAKRNEPSGSEKYIVANKLSSLLKERMIVSHLQFV